MVRKPKGEKLWVVDEYVVGRHSRVLIVPLPMDIIRLYDIRLGDRLKAYLVNAKSQVLGSRKVKLWFVDLFPCRRHSRRLYLPLDPAITTLYGIEKGDILKVMLVELFKSPREEEN